jgi:hypothetical protein
MGEVFGKMERDDLAAIYQYLKTVKPVAQQVTKFTAAGE